MALSAEEMRTISVAYYESPEPTVEEVVESILIAAQAVARQGKWLTIYDGSGFTFADVHDELNATQQDIVDQLVSLGYSPRIESLGEGLRVSW